MLYRDFKSLTLTVLPPYAHLDIISSKQQIFTFFSKVEVKNLQFVACHCAFWRQYIFYFFIFALGALEFLSCRIVVSLYMCSLHYKSFFLTYFLLHFPLLDCARGVSVSSFTFWFTQVSDMIVSPLIYKLNENMSF